MIALILLNKFKLFFSISVARSKYHIMVNCNGQTIYLPSLSWIFFGFTIR